MRIPGYLRIFCFYLHIVISKLFIARLMYLGTYHIKVYFINSLHQLRLHLIGLQISIKLTFRYLLCVTPVETILYSIPLHIIAEKIYRVFYFIYTFYLLHLLIFSFSFFYYKTILQEHYFITFILV